MPIIDDAYLEQLKKQVKEIEATDCAEEETFVEKSDKVFNRILKLASGKEQASYLLKQRLEKEGHEGDVIEDALSRAQNCGLVDDIRYAELLVRSRVSAGKGIQGIKRELRSLTIDVSIEELCPDLTPSQDEEVSRAIDLLNRKPPTSKNKKDTAYRRLVGKGFSSSVASTASRLWFESLEP